MEAIKEYLLLPPCQQQSWQGGLLSLWRLVRGRGEESGWERSSISTNAFIIWKEKNITKHIWSSWWWEWCQRKRRFPQTLLSLREAHFSFPCRVGGSWLARDNDGRRHSVGRVGVWFCLCKITHNNILRCYGVPLTVQMEESVKFPGDISAFPTPTQRRADKLRKPVRKIINL